jgi:diguanylate cyclase (GGDEF)-like protein
MNLDKNNISKSILILPVVSVIISTLIVGFISVFSIKYAFEKQKQEITNKFMQNLRITTKGKVNLAYVVVDALYKKNLKIYKNKELAKKITFEDFPSFFDKFRWPRKGYIFMFSTVNKGVTVYHINHKFMKINRWNLVRHGQKIMQIITNAAIAHPNGTYVRYIAYNPDGEPMDKISYVKVYKPLNILIGAGVYLNYLDKDLLRLQKQTNDLLNDLLKKIIFTTLISLILVSIIVFSFSKKIQRLFLKYEKQLENEKLELKKKSITDNLTGLFNRNYLKYIFDLLKAKANRENKKIAVLFIDLDYFKEVNDTLGHKYGDILLKVITKRLKNLLRKDDVIVRFGGDEFIVLMLFKKEDEVMNVIERMYNSLKESILLKNKDVYIDASIGISIYPDDSKDLDVLIKNADMAMYEAKKNGKGRFEFFKADLDKKLKEKMELSKDLIDAIKNESFEICFQPKIYKDESLYGSEVLIRWNHPTKGLLTPISFLPIAYEKNLITDIDFIVLKKAIKQYNEWINRGYNPGKISCNITTIDLENKVFINKIKNLLDENNFDAKNLILEVTEDNIMKYPEKNIKFLEELRKLGIGISIDDFGTGYSSLSYLKKLPITELKIDKSFVKDIGIDNDDEEIVRIIILLGRVLNLKIVAEGVENKIQKEFLLLEGVDIIQGYLYSPPLPADEFEENFLKGLNDS